MGNWGSDSSFSNLLFARRCAAPAFNLPAWMLVGPLSKMWWRFHGAVHRIAVNVQRDLVILADVRIVGHAGRNNDSEHRLMFPLALQRSVTGWRSRLLIP